MELRQARWEKCCGGRGGGSGLDGEGEELGREGGGEERGRHGKGRGGFGFWADRVLGIR